MSVLDICSRGVKAVTAALAGLSWVLFGAASVYRMVHGVGPNWVMGALVLAGAIAVTSTLTLAIVHTMPRLFAAWCEGVEYGRKVEAKRHEATSERGGLRAVR